MEKMDDFTSTLTLIREGKIDLPVGKNGRTELADEPLYELRQYISALEAGYCRLRHFFKISKKLITARSKPLQAWIDPNKRKPEDGEKVLVADYKLDVYPAEYDAELDIWTGISTCYSDRCALGSIKYWMPLPTPPEEG